MIDYGPSRIPYQELCERASQRTEGNRNVRMQAVEAIGELGELEPFIDVLRCAAASHTETDRNVRIKAVEAIARLGDLQPFTETLRNAARVESESDRNVRIAAVQAIAKAAEFEPFIETLRAAISEQTESDRNVRMEAVDAIAQLGKLEPFVDVLRTAASETSECDRNVRMKVIQLIYNQEFMKLISDHVLEQDLRDILAQDSDLRTKEAAGLQLLQTKPELLEEIHPLILAVQKEIERALASLFKQARSFTTEDGTFEYVKKEQDEPAALKEEGTQVLDNSVFRRIKKPDMQNE